MMSATLTGRRNLLLTFDAFSTLFYPRHPIQDQYALIAYSFGLSASVVTPAKLVTTFRDAFKKQSKRFPNYGRQQAILGQYGGPRQWWADVVRGSFSELGAGSTVVPANLPRGMVEEVLDQFASQKGYALYEDVRPFFDWLKLWKMDRSNNEGPMRSFDKVVVGVISNSDDRVPAVLKSLGLRVGNVRADQDISSSNLPGFEERPGRALDIKSPLSSNPPEINDIDIVITSYEAGEEKPHRLIFDVAKRQASKFITDTCQALTMDGNWFCLHVGDNYEKDYKGAIDAGWSSQLLSRRSSELGHDKMKNVEIIHTLSEIIPVFQRHHMNI